MGWQLVVRLVLLVVGVNSAYGAKILAVFPTPSYSHQIVFQPIWRELSVRGHQVTVLTTDPLEDPSLTNLTEINLSDTYAVMREFTKQMHEPLSILEMGRFVMENKIASAEHELSNRHVKALIQNDSEHFDLVVMEWLFTGWAAFGERFNCPVVGLNSLGAFTVGHDTLGNPSHPAINTDFMLPYNGDLSLYERVTSTIYSIWIRYHHHYSYLPTADKLLKKHFGDDLKSLSEIEKKISLLLLNVNSIFYPNRANVPAVVELGGFGIHIKPRKQLPQDIKKYLDNSINGVIYFSFGSNIHSSSLKPEKLEIIKETLSELPYDVLWKFENEQLPGKPRNVRIEKWLPQQDLLGHPNIKLFINQGGLQSLEEAIFNTVPCLGVPFFTEQVFNMKAASRHGFAKMLEFKHLTKDRFKSAILEVISNSTYRAKAREVAEIVNDQPMKAVDKAVWWIEYVIRHKGARHLRSPAADMPWHQYLLLDVVAVILTISTLCIFIAYNIILHSVRYLIGNVKKFKESKLKTQ